MHASHEFIASTCKATTGSDSAQTAAEWWIERQPPEHLKDFTIPLRPMLGCVAVAPGQDGAVRTTDSSRFGGNMDYNQIVEGTTIYLPVNHPGALLFVGDGHATQGGGELTGDALETSDIEFTVDMIERKNFGHPLAEDDEYLISIGIGGSLDQALQMATSGSCAGCSVTTSWKRPRLRLLSASP